MDRNWLYGEFKLTERDIRLHELATEYHTECEAFDRTVCTGPIMRDGIMPANAWEMGTIGRNARTVLKRLKEKAASDGISDSELWKAIQKQA